MRDVVLEVPGQVRQAPEPEVETPKKAAKNAPQATYERGPDNWIRMTYAEAEAHLKAHGKLPEDAKAVLTERGRFLNAAKYDGRA